MSRLHGWPHRPPAPDTAAVGVSFVDVLFALVIARVLEPFAEVQKLTGPGIVHLVLAGILTLTSWIGYHNSLNRPKFFIRFPNLPLWQFLLDISMVVVYWLTAVTAEHVESPVTPPPTALPEAVLVAISFLLYVAWDYVALAIRRNPDYYLRPMSGDVKARRNVTVLCFVLSAGVLGAVFWLAPDTDGAVYLVDGLLIALLVGFRLLKEYVTPEDAGLTQQAREYQESLDAEQLPGPEGTS